MRGTSNSHQNTLPRLMVLGRLAWLCIVGLALVQWCISIPTFFRVIQQPCSGAACNVGGALPADGLAALHTVGITPLAYAIYILVLFNAVVVVWLVVALAIFLRRAEDPGALLIALLLAISNLTAIGGSTSTLTLNNTIWAWPIAIESFLNGIMFPAIFCLFPNGRFVPRWTRWIVLISAAQSACVAFLPADAAINNDHGPLGPALAIYHLTVAFCIIFAQIYRYRRASSLRERQQTKWAVLGLVIAGTGVIVLNVAQALIVNIAFQVLVNTLFPLVLLAILITIGIAILRSQLYDIDIIINRVLVYGLLTGLLAAFYFGSVFGLQSLLGGITRDSQLTIVASTLLIAALFQPLRRRIQALIDSRFYRRKYDAAKTLDAFAVTLRQEIDLADLSDHLLAVVEETMQPTHAALWLRSPALKVNDAKGSQSAHDRRHAKDISV
ncbi:MAG TPA: hypothetical protein VF510_07520 [Ktedonobacterales bacterium]